MVELFISPNRDYLYSVFISLRLASALCKSKNQAIPMPLALALSFFIEEQARLKIF